MGRDSTVGIAARYGLEGPSVESQKGQDFWTPLQTGLGDPPGLLRNGYVVIRGGKTAGARR
jgi:hypothetical protein